MFFFWIVILLALIYLRKVFLVLVSLRWVLREVQQEISPVKHYPKAIILIPMYKEVGLVRHTLEHFSKMKYPIDSLRIFLVTTAREDIELETAQSSTFAEIKDLLEQNDYPNMFTFHSSEKATCKSDQVNEVIDYLISTENIDENDTFIGIYDADSRPDYRTILYIAYKYSRLDGDFPVPVAFQQTPLYVHNYNIYSNTLLQFRPFLHNAYYFFSTELPHYLASCNKLQPAKLLHFGPALTHLLGHGEFIRFDTLRSVGGFQLPSCDTLMGYDLSFLQIPVFPVPYIDNSETPIRLPIFFKQNKVWFNGVMHFWQEFIRLYEEMKANRTIGRGLYMVIRVMNDNLSWALYPWFLLMTIIYLLATRQFINLFLFVLTIHIPCIGIGMIMLFYRKFKEYSGDEVQLPDINRNKLFLGILWFFPQRIANAIGPALWLHNKIRVLILHDKMMLTKTER